jgi:hypothetical protein
MNIDLNRPVAQLSDEELAYLGDLAKQRLEINGIASGKQLENRHYVYQPYPKFIKELNIEVKSEQEEKQALKAHKEANEANNKISDLGNDKDDDKHKSKK